MQLPRHTLLIAALLGGATLLGGVAIAGGWGPHHGPMGAGLLDSFDTNDDGKLTQAEIDEARKANLTKFDTRRQRRAHAWPSTRRCGPMPCAG